MPVVTAGDRSLPCVLARTWHAAWMQLPACSCSRPNGAAKDLQL